MAGKFGIGMFLANNLSPNAHKTGCYVALLFRPNMAVKGTRRTQALLKGGGLIGFAGFVNLCHPARHLITLGKILSHLMKPDIYTIKIIEHGFLAVMAKPVSGEWIEDEFSNIASEGILQIISLLEKHEEHEVGLQNEKALAEKNGIKYISYPIKDRGLPKSVTEFGSFTKNVYQQISGGVNTVIHCRAGIGRTGIVAAGVLLYCGYDAEEAFKLISQKRGVKVPDTDEQEDWLIANQAFITSNS